MPEENDETTINQIDIFNCPDMAENLDASPEPESDAIKVQVISTLVFCAGRSLLLFL
jgi:hypothetical protein